MYHDQTHTTKHIDLWLAWSNRFSTTVASICLLVGIVASVILTTYCTSTCPTIMIGHTLPENLHLRQPIPAHFSIHFTFNIQSIVQNMIEHGTYALIAFFHNTSVKIWNEYGSMKALILCKFHMYCISIYSNRIFSQQ